MNFLYNEHTINMLKFLKVLVPYIFISAYNFNHELSKFERINTYIYVV